jgi:hypothetical protein
MSYWLHPVTKISSYLWVWLKWRLLNRFKRKLVAALCHIKIWLYELTVRRMQIYSAVFKGCSVISLLKLVPGEVGRCIVDNAALLINYSVGRSTQWLKLKMFALLPTQMIILLMEKTRWKYPGKSLTKSLYQSPPSPFFFIISCPSVLSVLDVNVCIYQPDN